MNKLGTVISNYVNVKNDTNNIYKYFILVNNFKYLISSANISMTLWIQK